ncbi:cell division protein [Pseudomonas frederiksbergensis]|uniref:Cell division protein n=1 Tax=Pseudomonas frederiksbergensis TaxID=104087 RepID=A0A423JMJ0_9PSED|nr:cell division protein [Pseudomonas frederiksbergensis]RON38910.1 cell division protein [Pseudomonas frederiksbergensis]
MPVPSNTLRKALVAWLYAAALVHLLVSIILTWVGPSGWLDVYLQNVDYAFWTDLPPRAAREQQLWWFAVFGATLQSYSLYMLGLVRIGNRLKSPMAWGWLIAGIVLWAPQDMWFSLTAQLWVNLWIDGFALLTLLPPLIWLYRHDRRAASSNTPPSDADHA